MQEFSCETGSTQIVWRASKPLSLAQITDRLRSARANCDAEQSHFYVSAILEIPAAEGFIYVTGVNAENMQHNVLSIHAEQNALAAASALLGDKFRVNKVWVMGAPKDVNADSAHALVDNLTMPCGHCRQILASFSDDKTAVQAVAVSGKASEIKLLKDLLPDAFSEKDLGLGRDVSCIYTSYNNNRLNKLPSVIDLLVAQKLTAGQILHYFNLMTPHITFNNFNTTPVTKVILELANGYFIPGIRMQDVAFQTTDAIFSALSMAISMFGPKQVQVKGIHVFTDHAEVPLNRLLTGAEKDVVERFAGNEVQLSHYCNAGLVMQKQIIERAAIANETLMMQC